MKIAKSSVNYNVETLRAFSPALRAIVLYIRNCRGSGVSNPLTLLSECNTPTYFKNVETLGEANGYIN